MTEAQVIIALLGLGFAVISGVTIYLTSMVKNQRAEWDREHTRLWDRLDGTLQRLQDESREAHKNLCVKVDSLRLETKADIAAAKAEVLAQVRSSRP